MSPASPPRAPVSGVGYCLFTVLLAAGCGGGEAPPAATPKEVLSGGDTTIFDESPGAFAFPARNLSSEHRDTFFLGNTTFNRNWVQAPASVTSSDGLGPLFNATSCSACHFKDGRGAPPASPGEPRKPAPGDFTPGARAVHDAKKLTKADFDRMKEQEHHYRTKKRWRTRRATT